MLVVLAPFAWSRLDQWRISPIPLALLVLVAVAYALGVRRAPDWPARRTVCFALGLVVAFLATESVLGVYDTMYFADHMIQHLLLVMGAGPLIAAGAPYALARRVARPRLARVLDGRVIRVAMSPLVAFALYAAFVIGIHLSSFFDVMIEHPAADHLEQIAFVAVGYLFFRHALGIDAAGSINPGLRLVYVMAAVPVDTITGLALDMEQRNPFPDFRIDATATRADVINNVHLGGAIMWIGGDALMLLALIPIAFAWVAYESARTRELDARLDAAGL